MGCMLAVGLLGGRELRLVDKGVGRLMGMLEDRGMDYLEDMVLLHRELHLLEDKAFLQLVGKVLHHLVGRG